MMATRNLAWMPTLSYDTQAVLATDKVRFQGQEVACVIADDPYIAKDACEAIDVDYEPLPVDRQPEAGDRRGRAGHPGRQGEPGTATSSTTGRSATRTAPTARSSRPTWSPSCELHYPRSHPSPIECCGSIADFNRATSKLTVYMTTQAPHIIRAAVALVAELPEHMIRIVSPGHRRRLRQQGAGLPGLRLLDPGLDPAGAAGQVDRGQDRQPDLDRLRPRRLPATARWRCASDGKILGVRMHTDADHGAFFSDAQPSKFKIGLMHSAFACYDIPAAHLTARGIVHQQGARRGRLPVLVPGHRGDVLPGTHGAGRRRRPRHGPGRVPADELRRATTTSRTAPRSAS